MAEQYPVITISREYGAGGRSIARALSQKLGLVFYDIDFVRLTAKASGYSEADIKQEGEEISGSLNFINSFLPNTASFTNSYDKIYEAQRDVILELAKKPCIIVGRCSNVILREAGVKTFDIFLYADQEYRVKRAKELGEHGDADPEKYVQQRDHWRRNYFKRYTGKEMGDYHNYHISLDVGALGLEQAASILETLIKSQS